jgi:hypothetical protein
MIERPPVLDSVWYGRTPKIGQWYGLTERRRYPYILTPGQGTKSVPILKTEKTAGTNGIPQLRSRASQNTYSFSRTPSFGSSNPFSRSEYLRDYISPNLQFTSKSDNCYFWFFSSIRFWRPHPLVKHVNSIWKACLTKSQRAIWTITRLNIENKNKNTKQTKHFPITVEIGRLECQRDIWPSQVRWREFDI